MPSLPPAIQTVIENGNRLFANKLGLLSHWQEVAQLFYYDRATFMGPLAIGTDYAAGAFASNGALYRREMGNTYRPMLRPPGFFEIKALDKRLNKDSEARGWLQYATEVQRAVMYRNGAFFTRACDIADHDHVTFGQAALEVCPTLDRRAIYYRAWHLRDVAWSEDYTGAVTDVHRNDQTTLRNLVSKFGDKVPETMRTDAVKDPYRLAKVRHVVVPANAYDVGYAVRSGLPFVSLWVMPDEGVVLENLPRAYRGYVIPRAATIDGSQYARSPFTSIILPDARTAQVIERILLEAGEKAVDPPMIATSGAVIRDEIGLYAGGLTWVDAEYDEKLGEALRPVNGDPSGLPFGQDMAARYDALMRVGFMLDKISVPDTKDMTAYQIRKVVEQQMRAQIPIFGPIEDEYSEPLCAETFAVMRALGAFPSHQVPDVLRGANVEYTFNSPFRELEDDSLKAKLMEGMEVVKVAAEMEPAVARLPDPMAITRDLLQRLGWPEEWLKDEKRVGAEMGRLQEQQEATEAAAAAAGVAESAGKAAPALKALADMRQRVA